MHTYAPPTLDVSTDTTMAYLASVALTFASGVAIAFWTAASFQAAPARAAATCAQSVGTVMQLGATGSSSSGASRALGAAQALLRVGPTKMTLLVRKDLKMGTGKIAAQCAHAAVAAVDEVVDITAAGSAAPTPYAEDWVAWLSAWRHTGSAKVVLQCEDEAALLAAADEAKRNQLPFYVIADAGRTQIAAGSRTVLAVGPAPVDRVDRVTGKFKLL